MQAMAITITAQHSKAARRAVIIRLGPLDEAVAAGVLSISTATIGHASQNFGQKI